MKKRLVISGGSGLLATNLACNYMAENEVILLLNKRMIHLDGCQTAQLENTDKVSVEKIIKKYKPDVWINAAALTDIEFCEKNPETAKSVNCDLAALFAECTYEHEVFYIHISSDHLFDGVSSFVDESKTCSPINAYAQSKYEAEIQVIKKNPDAVVVRTSFFGWGPPYRKSLSDWVLEALHEHNTITLFDDVYITPVTINYLAKCLTNLFEAKYSGIMNVSSSERISKYQLGLLIAQVNGLDSSNLIRGSLDDRPELTKRPRDMSISNKSFVNLFGDVPSLREQCEDLKNSEYSSAKYLVRESVLPYGKQFVDDDDISAVTSVIRGNFLTQGPNVHRFEVEFASSVNSKFAVAVSNGTAALHLACLSLDFSPGDLVVTTPLSFVATANAVLYAGADPIFVDVDRHTLNLDAEAVGEILENNPRVKAIIVVHFAGAPGPMEALRKLAAKYGVKLIEDASHALGASYADGSLVGSGKFSDLATFSLHPVKGVTVGEGGIITTNDETIYRKLLMLRSHGINKGNFQFLGISDPDESFFDKGSAIEDGELRPWYYEMQCLGYNYRLTDFQCALGTSQLKKLEAFIEQRKRLVALYDEAFLPLRHISPTQLSLRSQSSHHIYVTEIDFEALATTRHKFMKKMMKAGIGSQVHYIPIVAQPFYQKRGFHLDDYPNTKAFYEKALTLPLYYQLTPWQQEQVIDFIMEYVVGNA